MEPSAIGRRFERLLFFAGPLALMCVLMFFVAYASEEQEERRRAKCLRSIAEVIANSQDDLEAARSRSSKLGPRVQSIEAWSALRQVLIPWEVRNSQCDQYLPKFDIKDKIPSPSELIERLSKEADVLVAKPLTLYGVELPDRASISALGTPIRMELQTLVRVLQVVLGPILVLWLGSLYNTRHRETLFIGHLSDVRGLYPHLINVYPVSLHGAPTWNMLRKRSWIKFAMYRYGQPALYACIRIGLLSVFIAPPVGFYFGSLLLLDGGSYSSFFAAVGLVVALFALGNIICELLPWHVEKRFSIRPSATL
ncbi:hypothetical protein ACFQNJ_10435 [Hydrogenophaga bisanensis]|uniref:Transmembrane protein n=1 Tax=Hydrogenophaga bisanensis TaxID=439611 RepID=A0ABW2RA19_9BURK